MARTPQSHVLATGRALRAAKLTENTPANWADYDTVFIGYPIWWGIAAWPVNDFVTANDFTGKTVIPFCTSASSGLGDSGKLLAERAGEGSWQAGQRFSGGAARTDVEQWYSNSIKNAKIRTCKGSALYVLRLGSSRFFLRQIEKNFAQTIDIPAS